jgi:hypothetical protein
MTELALNRRPYRRRNEDEWAEVEALYRAGATAKALAAEYGGTERTIYTRASRHGWLRRDDRATKPKMTPKAAEAKARRISGVKADAPVRALKADADLSAATRAAVRTTVGMLRDGHPARAYAYGRLAALMLRLDRVLGEVEGSAPGGRTPQEEAALAVILERLGIEG